ncbi:MAG: GNAT family N-acetyltransferase [Pseudomonadota bacterium]
MAEISNDPPTDIETLREAQAESQLWVACDGNDVPIGFVLARLVDGALYIQELDVMRAYQRRGIGGRLIAAVCDAARDRGDSTVMLSTFADVPWNAPYYERLGFRRLEHAELTPALRAIEAEEAAFGLDTTRRVFMGRTL